MLAPPAGFLQSGSLTALSGRNQFCYGYLCLCHAQMFISTYFLRVSFKKSKELRLLHSVTTLGQDFACTACFLRKTSHFSTMQHFKVLLVLLFVAAISISLTQAWTMNSKKVGKRKQILPFSYRSLFSSELSSAVSFFRKLY